MSATASRDITAEERARESVRVRNQVRLVKPEEEGSPIYRIPNGVYGFTYTPTSHETGLFAKRSYLCFELHKLADGSAQVFGYLTAAQKAAFESGQMLDLELFPEVYEDATEPVAVPLERVGRAKPLNRAKGNALPIWVRSAVEAGDEKTLTASAR
jgi:hypothetical protein